MYRLFSVDDHIIEPAHVWASRLPQRFVDRGPRVIHEGDREFWIYEDTKLPTMGLNAVAGKPPEEWGNEPVRFDDMTRGCFDPEVRAEEMRTENIVGSVPFPTLPGFGGRVFYEFRDKQLADACVCAYNDFIFDEWCAAAPELYVPTVIVQLWDPQLAATEIRRCADRGARTVAFPDNPFPMGLPSIHDNYWDPVWNALEETASVLSVHIGASGRVPSASSDSPYSASIVTGPAQAALELIGDLVLSRIPHEYPRLRWVVTEGGIGYLPYVLERLDLVWEKNRAWEHLADERPSQTFERVIWVCAVNEMFGIEQRERIGIDKILWECDYPHAETTWPNSQALAAKQFAGVGASDVDAITHENAQSLFRWEGARY